MKLRNRAKLDKSAGRLRISIFKSNKHFYVQLINDAKGTTLASASTLDDKIRNVRKGKVNAETIKQVSSLLIERLPSTKLQQGFVFDQGGI